MTAKTLMLVGGVLFGTAALGASARADDPAGSDTRQQQGSMQQGSQGSMQSGQQTGTMSDQNLRKVDITVMNVDKSSNTVTFKAHVSPEASVQKSGQPIRLDQLKPGDEVRAAFDPKTGEVMKLEIKKGSPRDQTTAP